jgi:hypothetical protein
MMRTIEVLLVIIIITAAFIISSFFAVLPQPREVSPLNLRRLALTTLQTLDRDYDLSQIVFKPIDDPSWSELQIALAATLPPNVIYNLTVYEVSSDGAILYSPIKSISNAESLGIESEASSYLVASSNVTFNVVPEKIGEKGGGGTLYILNCSDANGWWITGYTAQSLAQDLYNLLSPYFQITIMIQNTAQLAQILNGTALQSEVLQNAVIINTFGEAVPIPSGYYASSGVGYDATGSYARYCHTLGQRIQQYNWTWISIVGYPFYYVSNTDLFSDQQNTWGIYGMKNVGPAGLNAFLRGINEEAYVKDDQWITLGNPPYTNSSALVQLSPNATYFSNYYGIYPSPYQTATRAVPSWIQSRYNLNATAYIFDPVDLGGKTWIAGATFVHYNATGHINGKFIPVGLTRTPDIRITALAILSYYTPRLYRSEYTAYGTSRFVVLQLGLVGGI